MNTNALWGVLSCWHIGLCNALLQPVRQLLFCKMFLLGKPSIMHKQLMGLHEGCSVRLKMSACTAQRRWDSYSISCIHTWNQGNSRDGVKGEHFHSKWRFLLCGDCPHYHVCLSRKTKAKCFKTFSTVDSCNKFTVASKYSDPLILLCFRLILTGKKIAISAHLSPLNSPWQQSEKKVFRRFC